MFIRNIGKAIYKHRRGLLTLASFIFSGLSFGKIWKSRHEIDQIMEETAEARHSEDKEVRKEAKWQTMKKLAPKVLPSLLGLAVSTACAVGAHTIANAEIVHYHHVADEAIRMVAESDREVIEEGNARRKIVAETQGNLEEYFFIPTGEVVYFPKYMDRDTLILDINIQIRRMIDNSGEGQITLGEIRRLLDLPEPNIADDAILWTRQNALAYPELVYMIPNDVHGDDKLMWELYVDGQVTLDSDAMLYDK